MSDNMAEKLEGLAKFMRSLTAAKVFLLMLLGLGGVVIYTLFEARAGALQAFASNPILAFELMGVMILLVVGYAFNYMQQRIDERGEAVLSEMRSRLTEVSRREERCNERNEALEKKIMDLVLQLQRAGIEIRTKD